MNVHTIPNFVKVEDKKTITFKMINQDVIPFDHLFGLFFAVHVCFVFCTSLLLFFA